MGYVFLPNTFSNNEDFYLKEIKSSYHENVNILDYSIRGNHVFELLEITKDSSVDYLISVIKISRIREDNSIGYKWMDETYGPVAYNCPQKYLKKSTSTNEIAIEWRKKCFDYHKNVKLQNQKTKEWKEKLKGLRYVSLLMNMDKHKEVTYLCPNSSKSFAGITTNNEMYAFKYSDINRIK